MKWSGVEVRAESGERRAEWIVEWSGGWRGERRGSSEARVGAGVRE